MSNKELETKKIDNTVKAEKVKKDNTVKTEKVKKELTISQRKVRHGIFATTSVIIVIAIVIAVNLFLSTKEWNYDFTKDKLYTLSKQSVKIAKNLKNDQKITIYFLDKESKTNTVYKNILSQYEKAGKYIDVQYKDLDVHPDFASKYLSDGQKAAKDDLIVVCGDKSRYISSSDYLSYSYGADNSATTTLNMEPKITAAINYCIEKESPKIYTLTGQGEQELGNSFKSALESDNYDVEQLDILSQGGIPGDCKLLIINAPTSDISKNMITMIEEYMENDGKVFVVLDPNEMYKNLNAFLKGCGVQVEKGIIIESGSGYYMGNYPTYLIPTMANMDITKPLSDAGLKCLAPVCKGLTAVDSTKGYTAKDVLVTSSESYSKVDTSSDDFSKKKDDIAGPLAIAQLVENEKGEGVMFVSGSSSMCADEIDEYVSNANSNLYSNAVNYMTNEDSKISIKAPTVTNEYAVFTAFATKMIMVLGVIGLPLFLIILGVVVVIVRRKN